MNLYDLPEQTPAEEIFETLVPDKGVLIEKIVSYGQATKPGEWLIQDRDEWVALLKGQAILSWKDGRRRELGPGDWLFIPAHEAHRVEWTSSGPPCIWIAVHGKIAQK